MKIVEIVSRDPSHANRLFDTNGVEYSHPLGLNIPELPFSAVINSNRRIVTGRLLFESDNNILLETTNGIEELVML